MVENLKALAEKWRDSAYDLQRFGQGGGLYLVCANELLAALESQAAPEVCRSLPAAEQAVVEAAMECIKAPWTGIAGSREGLLLACAALAKLRQGEGA